MKSINDTGELTHPGLKTGRIDRHRLHSIAGFLYDQPDELLTSCRTPRVRYREYVRQFESMFGEVNQDERRGNVRLSASRVRDFDTPRARCREECCRPIDGRRGTPAACYSAPELLRATPRLPIVARRAAERGPANSLP